MMNILLDLRLTENTRTSFIEQDAHHFKGVSRNERIAIPSRCYQARYTNVTPVTLFLECRKGTGVGYVVGKQRESGAGGNAKRDSETLRATPRAYS